MKIERKEAGFAPIALIIESQMEMDVLSELADLAMGLHNSRDVEDFVSEVSEELLNMGAFPGYKYFCDVKSRLVAKQPNTQ